MMRDTFLVIFKALVSKTPCKQFTKRENMFFMGFATFTMKKKINN